MLVGLYAIYDVKAVAYLSPFTMATDGMAKRAFVNEVKRPDSMIGATPSDFSLYRLGYFDDNAGSVTSELNHMMTGDEARGVMLAEKD